ncbi:EAL domain-containing protein [Rhodoferax sp. GW822-FHT02A01]|uniref:EAL domain-containing protein n=1 Tax=Rhodoferax sp. GW822-FHT02A01 TaxID=3141537 RepID=UPI00315D1671
METEMGRVDRINRFLTMLSRVNRAIVRADSPDRLYRDVCDISVESNLFQFAWIGLVDPTSGHFRQMAQSGHLPGNPHSPEVIESTAQYVLQRQVPIICNDLENGTGPLPCQKAMLDEGFLSMAGLPLKELSKFIGVFMLYCSARDVVDPVVSDLLDEVAADVSFSLGNMRADQQRLAGESKLYYLAFYDAQTGLPNRALLDVRLPNLAAMADRNGRLLTMVNIRLRRVEQIVLALGRLAMDEVLRRIASRLDSHRGQDGLVVQLAPDEFVIVTPELQDGTTLEAFARKVRDVLSPPFKSDGKDVYLQMGIGVVAYPLHENDWGNLLRRAQAATDQSTEEIGYRLYSADLDRGLAQRFQMLTDLHRALEQNEFVLHFQPQLNLRTGIVVGVEALLRWQNPKLGLVGPAQFIPLLEEAGLMPKVGAWVLRMACQQAKAWQLAGHAPLRMAVNLSAQQFRSPDLIAIVRRTLEETQLDAEFLELELTESLILESAEQTISMMHQLKSLGITLSLDDFGTGYSSLSYLQRYPVDRIKIDQSFVRDMTQHTGSAALVRSILAMAASLGLETIAEGVETKGQHGYLRKQMCQESQGYLYSRPVPPQDIAALLVKGEFLQADVDPPAAESALLIVDDELNVLAAMRRIFRRERWPTLTTSSTVEAFELLAAHEVGVIISDQRMPSMTGTDFLHAVKEMYPDTIRLLLTGYADFSTVINAVNRGDLFKVLSKPIGDAELRESVHEAFRRFNIFSENRRLLKRVEVLERMAPVLVHQHDVDSP